MLTWTRFLLGCWAILGGAAALGAVFAPYLSTHHPLVLVGASPYGRHMLLVAPLVSFWPFVTVVVLRRLASGLVFYRLGHMHGERTLVWIEARWATMGEGFRLIERWFDKFGPLLVVVGGMASWMFAGSTRMRLAWFVFLNVLGSVLMVVVLRKFADVLEHPIRYVLELFRLYMWEATALMAAFVLATQAPRLVSWLRRRQMGGTL